MPPPSPLIGGAQVKGCPGYHKANREAQFSAIIPLMSDSHFQICSVCVYTSCVIISFMHIQTLTPVRSAEFNSPNGVFNRFGRNVGEAQTWIWCLCNSPGAVGVVSSAALHEELVCLMPPACVLTNRACFLPVTSRQPPTTINTGRLFLPSSSKAEV